MLCVFIDALEWTDQEHMRRLRVKSREFDYDIVAGHGAWSAFQRFPHRGYSSIFVLTERPLWKQWGATFLKTTGLTGPHEVFVPSGEKSKSIKMMERVAATLLKKSADRRSLLIAFGGGVVGDLGGFVASTYMRGIDYVQVPTTVVAQVDSAIGGKTAVNVGEMKNLIGTFAPPRLVLADPVVLKSLPPRTFLSGFYEVAKHAVISGPSLFSLMEKAAGRLRPGLDGALESLLVRAAHVKVNVVNRDEREADLRRLLNLGHTFGHALEEATAYMRFLHGEAVGWGLLCAVRLGVLLNMLDLKEAERISDLVRRIGPLPSLRDLSPAKIGKLFSRDKKAVAGQIHWVVPEKIGRVRIVSGVPIEAAVEAFRSVQLSETHD
ncbi:MAG: 3-dehydroquinate synthase [Acidobacteria bacterium]|nr:MAG: 3-dehydroquinate synthase [Acidobacteriota bacterium]